MYGITENVIRVTIRLSESGTTYCRAYDSGSFNPVSQGGTDVPTLTDCTSCPYEIKTSSGVNFVGSSTYDSSTGFAEHEVDVSGLTAKTFYWVYCYSHDDEIPTVNVATSSQMLATERSVRTLDTTPPSFSSFSCVETPGTEACVPTHFLLGRQLHTPMFPVTSAGLSGGWSAWGALYGALHSVGSRTKRRNRFSSVRCGMNAEELQETWQRLRSVYSSMWMAAGQSSKRLEAHLIILERHFGETTRKSDMSMLSSSQDAEQKIEKLLQRWNKRKPSGSKR